MSTYSKAEDMINIGAYVKGSNPKIDQAIRKNDAVNAFLRQRYDEDVNLSDAFSGVEGLTKD
jgi:flagellum-specific ATP synthase